jgi:tetratricopeptide (TPR) repeat protein
MRMKAMKTRITMLLSVALAGEILAAQAWSDYPRVPGITYADQPTGIELSVYLTTWPALESDIHRLRSSQRAAVKADLQQRAASKSNSDGGLNLLAQLQREDGALDDADNTIKAAIAMRPNQFLHSFQQAMISFARLMRGSGLFERWKWQQKTRDAYQRTLDLNPRSAEARYYIAYSYLNTPAFGGGSKDKGLELSEKGIALGQDEFYVVRADAHRMRGELDAAFADYDKSIQRKVFKLSAFLAAGQAALERRDLERAKRYLEWAVHCRPDAGGTHEGLGDYYVAAHDPAGAIHSYESALQKEPNRESVKKKLAKLGKE